MRRLIMIVMAVCLLLGGCAWMEGSYYSVTPHQQQLAGTQSGSLSASSYLELRTVLKELVEAGTESAVIHVAEYDQEKLADGMVRAVSHVSEREPIGAYAVEKIEYEIGTGGGQPAVSVEISYIHGRSEIRKIRQVRTMEEAETVIEDALGDCSEGVVLLVEHYEAVDLVQKVEDFTRDNPELVMEQPQVAVGVYPEEGSSRVVELKFTYQTSRESLRQMQSQVQRVFASAALYVNGSDADAQKYAQLYAFLMERFDYQIDTSITPAYSLLQHGVGDSEAFAEVYAAICRRVGLHCSVVSGTRDGEAWFWNQICDDGTYYHVDLLRSSQAGAFTKLTDDQMTGYVWDYSAYPASEPETAEP